MSELSVSIKDDILATDTVYDFLLRVENAFDQINLALNDVEKKGGLPNFSLQEKFKVMRMDIDKVMLKIRFFQRSVSKKRPM